MAAGGNERRVSTTTTATMTSRRGGGGARRRKSRKNSRRKQRPRPSKQPTISTTGTIGNATPYLYEIATPTSGRSAANSRVPAERGPINRKSATTATTKGQTGNAYATSLSVLPSRIATAVPYVNLGGVETSRRDDVTSGAGGSWSEAGTTSSLAAVIGLAVVSVIAFWLVVTVIVLPCLLTRRGKAAGPRRRTGGCGRGGGGVVDSRWSWSGHQLIGLLDDSLLDAPLHNAHLFSTADDEASPPPPPPPRLHYEHSPSVSRDYIRNKP